MSPQLPEMYGKAMQSHEQRLSSFPTEALDRIHSLISTAKVLQEDWERREQVHLAEVDRLKQEVEEWQIRDQIHLDEVHRLKQEIEEWQRREKLHLAEVDRLREEKEIANRNYSLLSTSSQQELDLQVELLTKKMLFMGQEQVLKSVLKSYHMANQEVESLRRKDCNKAMQELVESSRQELNKAKEMIQKLKGEIEEERKTDRVEKEAWVNLQRTAQTLLVSTSPPSSFCDLLRLEYSKLKLRVYKNPSSWIGKLREDEVEELWEVMEEKERNVLTMAWLLGWEVVDEPQHLLYLAGSPPMRVAALYCQLIQLQPNLPIQSISDNIILPPTIFDQMGNDHLSLLFEKAKTQMVEIHAYIREQIPQIIGRLRYGELGLVKVLYGGLFGWENLQKCRSAAPEFSAQIFSFRGFDENAINFAISWLKFY